MRGISLSELFRAGEETVSRQDPPRADQVAMLESSALLYENPVPFKVGQLVTARDEGYCGEHLRGMPMKVVEVRDSSFQGPGFDPYLWTGDYGAAEFGCRPQVRVLIAGVGGGVDNLRIQAVWFEAANLRLYEESDAAACPTLQGGGGAKSSIDSPVTGDAVRSPGSGPWDRGR